MSNIGSSDGSQKLLSVQELETKLAASPDDTNIKEELAGALLDRYLDGDEERDPGDKVDLKRLKEILAQLPSDRASYERAYVAYSDKKDDEAVDFLIQYAKGSDSSKIADPFTADELYDYIVVPFAGPPRNSGPCWRNH